jgi:hypothetical protein
MASLESIALLQQPLARDRFPEQGINAEVVACQVLKEELLLASNSKQNLATFSQTDWARCPRPSCVAMRWEQWAGADRDAAPSATIR